MAKQEPPVSFRLTAGQRRQLEEFAESISPKGRGKKDDEKVSLGDAARLLVLDALNRPEAYTQRLQDLENQLFELRGELRRLAQVQMTSTREILLRAGKMNGPDAHRWVEKNLVEPYQDDSG